MDFFEVKGVKTGMLPSEEIVNVVRDCLAGTREISLVVDPVLAATSGSKLAGDCAFEAMKSQLFPRATLVTPNLDETEALTGERPNNVDELTEAAKILGRKIPNLFSTKGWTYGRRERLRYSGSKGWLFEDLSLTKSKQCRHSW